MFASSPEHIVQMMDKAFNEGDVNSLLGFYEEQNPPISHEESNSCAYF
jgi:hypothetical protein